MPLNFLGPVVAGVKALFSSTPSAPEASSTGSTQGPYASVTSHGPVMVIRIPSTGYQIQVTGAGATTGPEPTGWTVLDPAGNVKFAVAPSPGNKAQLANDVLTLVRAGNATVTLNLQSGKFTVSSCVVESDGSGGFFSTTADLVAENGRITKLKSQSARGNRIIDAEGPSSFVYAQNAFRSNVMGGADIPVPLPLISLGIKI